MPLTTAICLGKLCASGATILSALRGNPADHVKAVLDALTSGGEAAGKLRSPEIQTLATALRAAEAKLQSAYDDALTRSHSAAFREGVDIAFANLAEIFDSCLPATADLVRLHHDPARIAGLIADRAVANSIDIFRDGEPRQLLLTLVTLAYDTLDRDPAFMAALSRVNWTALFDQLGAVDTKLDQVLTLLRPQAEAAGLTQAALRRIAGRLGALNLADADLLPFLENWIAAAQDQLGRHTNEDAAFEAALREAERRFRAGAADPAAALMDEFAREERAERDRQKERHRRRIRLMEEAVRFDTLALRPEAAAAKLRHLAELNAYTTPDAIGAFLLARAQELLIRGRDHGEAAPLLTAIATYRLASIDLPRDRVPLAWATTQTELGNALAILGERETDTARLDEAVVAYRLSLEEHTRDRIPLDWAMSQNNLGNALATLGERQAGTSRLDEAVIAYRAALLERARERVPLDWAMTQNNLGTALKALGQRETGTARLDEAVNAYRAALLERTRERVPLDWAITQNNLGSALQTLGQRETGTARFDEAVDAHRYALLELTRDRVPLDWAKTQNNLGNALAKLGERETGIAQLDEAVIAYRHALLERIRDRVPLDWAVTQNNLGNALATLGERETGTARFDEAAAVYRDALLERTRDRVPLSWASTQHNLGLALAEIGDRTGDIVTLHAALEAFYLALEERTPDRVPLDHASTQAALTYAIDLLSFRQSNRPA